MFEDLTFLVGDLFLHSHELTYRAIVACGDTVIASDENVGPLAERLKNLSANSAPPTPAQIQRLQQELRTLSLFWLIATAKSFFDNKKQQFAIQHVVLLVLQQQTKLPARDVEMYKGAHALGKELDLFLDRLKHYFYFSQDLDPFQVNIPLLGVKQYIATRIAEPNFTTPFKQLKKSRPLGKEVLTPYREHLLKHLKTVPDKPASKK